jgi:hypothetical protein
MGEEYQPSLPGMVMIFGYKSRQWIAELSLIVAAGTLNLAMNWVSFF